MSKNITVLIKKCILQISASLYLKFGQSFLLLQILKLGLDYKEAIKILELQRSEGLYKHSIKKKKPKKKFKISNTHQLDKKKLKNNLLK